MAQDRRKYDVPEDKTPEWIIKEIYKDVKELKEVWCPKINQNRMVLIGVSLVCAIYVIENAQTVIDKIGKWMGLL